jgi:hypothetical protein
MTAEPLRVAHLDRRHANALEVGDELYLFLDADDAALIPARCPHRGGPLHLATPKDTARGPVLVCPWHGTPIPLRALRRRAVATVQSGPLVRAVVEAAPELPLTIRHLPVHLAIGDACTDCPADSPADPRADSPADSPADPLADRPSAPPDLAHPAPPDPWAPSDQKAAVSP